jgi:ABC-type sugar transport system ATPase subunit
MIYDLIAELAAAGKAIVMVSSELPELMAVCDRLVVLSDGRLAGEFRPETWTEEAINRAAFHHYLDA